MVWLGLHVVTLVPFDLMVGTEDMFYTCLLFSQFDLLVRAKKHFPGLAFRICPCLNDRHEFYLGHPFACLME